jgi:hypothetical protein
VTMWRGTRPHSTAQLWRRGVDQILRYWRRTRLVDRMFECVSAGRGGSQGGWIELVHARGEMGVVDEPILGPRIVRVGMTRKEGWLSYPVASHRAVHMLVGPVCPRNEHTVTGLPIFPRKGISKLNNYGTVLNNHCSFFFCRFHFGP